MQVVNTTVFIREHILLIIALFFSNDFASIESETYLVHKLNT